MSKRKDYADLNRSGRLLAALLTVLGLVGCATELRKPAPSPTLAAESQPAPAEAAASQPPLPTATAATADAGYQQGVQVRDPKLKLNLHVFGLSYHLDRAGIRGSGLDNEFNPGLGLNRELYQDARGIATVEGGFFKDSGSNWAKFAGVGYQFKFGEHWRLGADLLAMQSRSYNKGRLFAAPVPHLSYDFGAVTLNAVFVPRLGNLSEFAAFGFYVTTPLGQW